MRIESNRVDTSINKAKKLPSPEKKKMCELSSHPDAFFGYTNHLASQESNCCHNSTKEKHAKKHVFTTSDENQEIHHLQRLPMSYRSRGNTEKQKEKDHSTNQTHVPFSTCQNPPTGQLQLDSDAS